MRTPDIRLLTLAAMRSQIADAEIKDTKIDPSKVLERPQISVQNARVVREWKGHDFWYNVVGELDIIIESTDPVTTDELIKDVLDAVLCDPEWGMDYSRAPTMVTDYEYTDEGDIDVCAARIRMSVEWQEQYPPRLTETLNEVGFNVDVIEPAADPNLQYPGPDGRIEVQADVEFPA
jgi:hypothetical protein